MSVAFNPDGKYCVMIDSCIEDYPTGWPIHGMHGTLSEAREQDQFQGNPFTVSRVKFSAIPIETNRQYTNTQTGGHELGGIYLLDKTAS